MQHVCRGRSGRRFSRSNDRPRPPAAVLQLLVLLLTAAAPRHALALEQQQQQQQQQQPQVAAAGAAPAASEPLRLIVAFKDASVQAAAAAMVSAAAAGEARAAAASAAAAAAARGASSSRQAIVAAAAADALLVAPAITALASSVAAGVTTVLRTTTYTTVLRGAALQLGSAAEAELLRQQLQQHPDVERVWTAGAVRLERALPDSAAAASSGSSGSSGGGGGSPTAMTGNAATTGLQRLAELLPAVNGSGTLLCLVDSGVALSSSLYGCSGGVNSPRGGCRVVVGHDLVGDQFSGESGGAPRASGPNPTDCMGHGSAMSSVAATSNGVAPGALLGMFRVFGCQGSSYDDVVIEAIDRAVAAGCDIINLSLSGGSGNAENSVYAPVMRGALAKGVLVVKAAGNRGDGGPFEADVGTAAGALCVGAAGAHGSRAPLDSLLQMAAFSSYGPAATLELAPHVVAPGTSVYVIDMFDTLKMRAGTSVASPYVAGVLALWLQHKLGSAAAANQTLSRAAISQDAAMRGLVATAAPVPDSLDPSWRAPVAWAGAGVTRADAFLLSCVSVAPSSISLPSGLAGAHTTVIMVAWNGPQHPEQRYVTYDLAHEPAVALSVADGWYGTRASMVGEYLAAQVAFSASSITLDTSSPTPQAVQVTFSLPAALAANSLLYSGAVRLLPRAANANASTNASSSSSSLAAPPLTVPYQGHTRAWSAVRLLARPLGGWPNADALARYRNTLCWAPRSVARHPGALLDDGPSAAEVCRTTTSGPNSSISVSLSTLRTSPACSLRVVLVAEVPVQQLYLSLRDAATNQALGWLAPLDLPGGNAKSQAGEVWTLCLGFNGGYIGRAGRTSWLVQGRSYRLVAVLTGPLAAGDAALGGKAKNTTVALRGMFKAVR